MEIEEFTGLVHLTEKLGLISHFNVMDILSQIGTAENRFIDPKILIQNNYLTPWQISKIVAGEGSLLLFDGYQLLGPIGFGKLGRLYKAKKIDTGETVALKVLRKRHLGDEFETLNFLRQAEILKDIDHPNIIKTLDLSTGNGNTPPYFSMEWVRGGSIYDWLEVKTFLSCPEACLIMEEISKTLVFFQKLGITHGNLSGTKILFENHSQPKLNNFRYGTIFDPKTGKIQSQPDLSFDYSGLARHTKKTPSNSQSDIFFAGALLDKILIASGLKRSDAYFLNIIRCLPPENRLPLPAEVSNCSGFLERQISLVNPKLICCLGSCAAEFILNSKIPVSKLRGRLHDWNGIPVLCTYHPAVLIRNPEKKRDVWEDMKFMIAYLGRSLPAT
jgi:uracil-DNA glycosylase family 4